MLPTESLPSGYDSVNTFVSVLGPGGATRFIAFLVDVYGGAENLAAHTLDADDLLIHAEVRIGSATVMSADANPEWAHRPSLLQVYENALEPLISRTVAAVATVITEPTGLYGDQRLARVRDPWDNLWWLFEYREGSRAPSEQPNQQCRCQAAQQGSLLEVDHIATPSPPNHRNPQRLPTP